MIDMLHIFKYCTNFKNRKQKFRKFKSIPKDPQLLKTRFTFQYCLTLISYPTMLPCKTKNTEEKKLIEERSVVGRRNLYNRKVIKQEKTKL